MATGYQYGGFGNNNYGGNPSGVDNYDATGPANGNFSSAPMAGQGMGGDMTGYPSGGQGYNPGGGEVTRPANGYQGGIFGEADRISTSNVNGVGDDVTGAVPIGPSSKVGFSPVVGWLVCVDGPDKGRDYRIRSGYNHIGRAEHMDICIRGDMNISREKHALIAYDSVSKLFFFGPSEGRNIVRINSTPLMVPMEIHAYDVVTIGTSKLIFIPFCGDQFDWND